MKTFSIRALFASALISFLPNATFAQTGTALVQHAPSVNGTINGFVQQMAAESVTLNSGANISGDLLVPGTPLVQLNGTPVYSGTLEGNGSASPTGFAITLNTGSTLRHVVRRTNALILPAVATVPTPTGSASVTVTAAGQTITWTTLKNLTLNSSVGVFTVPAGTYGTFAANSGTGFKLGVAGATQASVYNFQALTLNSNSTLQVVGPVVINLANGFSANSTVGAASNPAWLKLNIKAGGYTLNTGCYTYGYVLAPSGTVIVNSGTQLVGGVTSAYLTVNSNGLLKLQPQQSLNQSPAVTLTAPANGTIFTSPASFALTASASDPDGTVTKVEFFRGTTKLGEDLTAPYNLNIGGVTAGTFSYYARATDNSGASTDSVAVSVTVNNPNQPPTITLTAPADAATFPAPATITVKATATDPDGAIAHVDFYQGSIMIGQSTTAPYQVTTSTLSAGAYVFSAKAYDNLNSFTPSGSVTVTVVNPNLPPTVTITAPADGTSYDDPANFIVTAAASDPDGSVYKVGFLRNGVLLGEDSTAPFSFSISALPVGTYDLVARATDNGGSSTDSVPVRITVGHINDAPTATAQSLITAEETPITITLAGTDPDGDPLTYIRTSQPGHGTLTPISSSVFTYTPAIDFSGTDSFTFKANDGALDSAPAIVSISVTPVNDAPVTSNVALSTFSNSPSTFTIPSFDADGDVLALSISQPLHGVIAPTSLPSTYTYTPAANYAGSDSATFTVSDGIALPTSGILTITVTNRAPVAMNGTASIVEDTPTPIQLAASDSDGQPAIYTIVTQPSHGILSPTESASVFRYTPQSNYDGTDNFTFKVNDGYTDSNVATIGIAITPVNDAPVATAQTFSTNEDEPRTFDLDGSDIEGTALSFAIVAPPAHGSLALITPPFGYKYTPAANYYGTDSFTFKVSDGALESLPAMVAITVVPVNDAPVADAPPAIATFPNTPVNFTLSGTDVDGDTLTFSVDAPLHGTVTPTASPTTFTYTPSVNYVGSDSATFSVSDGIAPSVLGALTITITNRAPIAVNGTAIVVEDTPTQITLTASDPDAQPLSYSIITQPSNGTLTPTGSPATFIFTPNPNSNESGSFTFLASDGVSNSNIANVTVSIIAVNDAPNANSQNLTSNQDTPLVLTLNGSDIEGAPLTYQITTPPAHGTLSAVSNTSSNNGISVTYSPASKFSGSDNFGFKVNDGYLDSDEATVSIDVKMTNQPPEVDAGPDQQLGVSPGDHRNQILLYGNVTDDGLPNPPAAVSHHWTQEGGPKTVLIDSPYSLSTLVHFGPSNQNPGNALHFSTLNDSVVIPAGQSFHPSPAFSWELWFKGDSIPTTTDSGWSVMQTIMSASDPVIYEDYFLGFGSEVSPARTLTFVVDRPGSGAESNPVSYYPPGGFVNGVWYHAVATQDYTNNRTCLYVNGVLRATKNSSAAPILRPLMLSFGRASDGASVGGAFPGSIDEVRIYDRELSAAEVAAHYANGAGTSGAAGQGLAGGWHFDEGSGTRIGDFSNSTHTSAITGSPTWVTGHVAQETGPIDSRGVYRFRLTADDGAATASDAVEVTVNNPPVANNQSGTAGKDATTSLVLTASDLDGDPLTFRILSTPSHGTLSAVSNETGGVATVNYTPTADFIGTDSFTFVANDGLVDSGAGTVDILVAKLNAAPVVDAGPDQQIRFTPFSGSRPTGRIVVNNDEWALTDAGFSASPYAGAFTRNLADFLTGGKPGAKFLAYTNVIPGSVEFIYTGSNLAMAMQQAGHTWVTSSTIEMTLANLKQYDAVFLGANVVDNQVLINYVESGGSVYLSAGSHWSGGGADAEAALWNPFLEHFGLHYNYPYNGVGGTLPVTSDNPLFYGIQTLYFANGNSVSRLNFEDPFTQIPFVYNGQGLFGMFGDSANQIFLHGTATDDGEPNPPGALTFHWTQVSGPSEAAFDAPTSLTTRVTFPASGSYSFRLTVSDGSKTSFDEVTVVANQPPRAHAGPDQVLRDTSQTCSLSGSATDDGIPQPALSYLWKSVAGPAPAEFVSATSKDTTVSFSAGGIYMLEFSANDGVYTGTDTVEVRVGMQSLKPPAGMVAWWPLNNSPVEIISGNHNFSVANNSYEVGKVGRALVLNSGNVAIAAAHPDLDLGSYSAGFTIEYWMKSGSSATMLSWVNGASFYLFDGNRFAGDLRESNGTSHTFDSYQWGQDVMWNDSSAWNHVAVCYDRAAGIARFYQNGKLKHSWSVGSFSLAASGDLRLGGGSFSGSMDEVTLYNRPLGSAEIAAIYSVGADGKSPPDDNMPPTVNAGPNLALPNINAMASLNGQVTDDNRPFGAPTITWTKVYGPGDVSFGDASAKTTTAKFSDTGTYILKLTASDNYLLPVSDLMEVRVGVAIPRAPAGLTAWWPGNGEPHEVVSGIHDVELVNGAGYTDGKVLQGFKFSGTNDYGRVSKYAGIDVGSSPTGYTMEFWINNSSSAQTFMRWADGASLYLIDGNRIGGNLRSADGSDHIFDSYYTFGAANAMWTNLTPWTHVAITYDRVSGDAQFFTNGQLKYAWNIGSFALATADDLYFGNGNFAGVLDEVSFYNRPLNPAEIAAIYNVGMNGKSPLDNNAPPTVDAGVDFGLPDTNATATLRGEVIDDNRPFGVPTISWSKVEGPGNVQFGDSSAKTTTANFSVAGRYLLKLTASDNYLSPVSDLVAVTVGGGLLKAPTGLAAWWPANGEPHEVVNGNHDVEFINGAGYATGKILQAFRFNGTRDYGRVLKHADTNIGLSAQGYTVEFWINSQSAATFLNWANGASLYLVDGNRLGGNLRDASGTNHVFDTYYTFGGSGTALWVNGSPWTHLAVAYDRPTGVAQFYLNGVLKYAWNVGSFAMATSGDLFFGDGNFVGLLDEVSFYNRPLSPAEVASIYNVGASGKSPLDDNSPPSVYAGSDISIPNIGTYAALNGLVNDDNRPFGLPTISWSKVEGPGNVEFGNASAKSTTASFSATGSYLLKLTASDNYTLPVSDLVVVRVGGETPAAPSGLAVWWPANGEPHEVINGNHDIELINGAGFATGKVLQALHFNGANDYGRVRKHTDFDLGSYPTGYTMEFWINSQSAATFMSWANGANLYLIDGNRIGGNLRAADGTDHIFDSYYTFGAGNAMWTHLTPWTHVAITYDRSSGVAQFFTNGLLKYTWNIGSFALATADDLYFGNGNFAGLLDEVSFYNRPLSPAEIGSIYNGGADGKMPPVINTRPVVNAGPDHGAMVGMPLSLAGSAVDDGLPNTPAALTFLWNQVSGPGVATFLDPAAATTSVSFSKTGNYVLRLTASDSLLSGSDDINVAVNSLPPTVAISAPANNSTVLANAALTLKATAADADGTIATIEFYDGTTKLGERVAPDTSSGSVYSLAVSSGFSVGVHNLTAKATDNDGVSTTSAIVTITSAVQLPQAPTISIFEPLAGPSVAINTYFEIAAMAIDPDGSIAKVEFFQGSAKLGEQIFSELGHPTTYFWPMNGGLPAGTYIFTAKATDNSGLTTTSAPVSVEVTATPTVVNTVYIATPNDSGRISAPTSVTGLVVAPDLTSWSLQYRLRPLGDDTSASPDPWLTAATGTSPAGVAATSGSSETTGAIGTFDPTSLINGIYELRLVAITSATTITTMPITLMVEGNMKIGAFTLAFEDMKVPVSGIPISIVRTYDSRDTRVGDFGPGWRLAVNNIRVQKNRNLGKDWYQTDYPGDNPPPLYPFYLEPVNERIVTVTMPDGESHRFRGGANVRNAASRPGDPDNVSLSIPSSTGKYQFYPLGDTTSKLEPLDDSNQLAETFYNEVYGTQDLTTEDPSLGDPGAPFNPTRFRLTTKDGTRYIVDEKLGLLKLEDLNGNSLVLNRDTQDRVTSIVSTQAAPSGTIVTTINIHRDGTGRVDYIRDLAGNDLDYTYDTQGRLESFTNRELNLTQFKYENPSFPYYLTKIIDPRGITALRSEFDENGKLFKQIDADGKETTFSRGIDAGGRFEKVKDRLGHESTFYYDDRGNVTTKVDPLNAITSFSYYPDTDWVKFETDHYGNTKSMAYDSRGNVTVQTIGASLTEDPANPSTGYTTRTVYNDRSAPTSITDPAGRAQSFSYDPATGNLLSNTVGVGGTTPATTTYHYNSDGSLDTVTDALGNVTGTTYNYSFSSASYPGAVKQVTVTVTDPAGAAGSNQANATDTVLRSSRTLYDSQENMLATIATRTLPQGGTEDIVTHYVYDSENRLTATIMPDGKVSETRYTSFGQTDKSLLWKSVADYTSQDDSLARVTSYGYDNRGNQTSTTYPDGTSESSHLDLENRRDWSQDRLGHRTNFKYDDVGRLRFTIQPDSTPDDLTDNPYTETVYDLTGRVTDTYDELRHRTTVTYYADGTPDAGRRKESIQILPTGNLTTTYQYDATGAVRFVTDPRGNTIETVYDDQGRPTTVKYPATDENAATQASTKYDVLGRRIETVDQEGKTTRFRYDGLGRLFQVRQYIDQTLAATDTTYGLPSSTAGLAVTGYSYDELGHQLTQTDARNNTTSYHYDSLGRRTQRILPDNSSESLQYDEWGNLWKRTDFKGYTTTFGYDVLNRLKTRTADATHPSLIYSHAIARVEYDYDNAGERTAARTYNATSVTPLYTELTPRDERGRLDSKTNALGTLNYNYYANGLLKDVVSSNSGGVNTGYRYDEANRLSHVDDASSGTTRTTSYTYNANGSLETVMTPNGVIHDYQYDSLNRLRTLSVTNTLGTLRSYTYSLNPSGHRHVITESTGRTASYLYDGIYRLTSEAISGAAPGQNGTIGYALDKVGNREARTSSVSTVPSSSNTFNLRDWLSGDTFDANGNTTLSAGFAQPDVYDFEDRLIIRNKPDGSSINFAYDADGLLRSKTVLDLGLNPVRTTQRLIDTNNPTGYAQVVEEYQTTSAGTTATNYTYGTDLISFGRTAPGAASATLSYFGYDGLGSVRTLTNAAGVITDTWDYDAFGNTVVRVGTTENAYLYRGEQYDVDLGMYYLRARFYNQNTGRFWNQDSNEGTSGDPASLHKYLYAKADPVGRMDPSGHFSMAEVQIGMVIVGTLNGMAINSARNTLGQASDVFNPTGDVAESLATINQLMFVTEWLNNAVVGVGAGLLAKQGVVALWTKIGPKLPKALDVLSRLNPAKLFQASLGQLGARSRLTLLRVSSLGEERAVIGNFSSEGIAGYDYKAFADALGADHFYLEPEIYAAMTSKQGFDANMAALDRFVAGNKTILVSTPESLMRLVNSTGGPTGLANEFNHFFQQYGLVLSSDGTRLVPIGITL